MEKRDTEREFITAFWRLYGDKPIEKISVGQLCASAGYNRATFYNHFRDIYDLFDRAVETILEPVRERLLSIGDFRELLQENRMEALLMSQFRKNTHRIELLFQRKDHDLLGEKIKGELFLHAKKEMKERGKTADTVMLEILLEYQISAVLGVIGYWFRRKKETPEQDILEIVYRISSKGVLPSLEETLG